MTKGWDWTIGTGLYVAALVLSWLTLISIERFSATEIRSWAPLIQAVLSAAAIFSAWWLQNQKRKSDRKELERETVVALLEYAYVFEWTLGRAVLMVRKGDFPAANIPIYKPLLEWAVDGIGALKIAHMPNSDAVREFVAFQHSSRLAISVLDWALENKLNKLSPTYLDNSWASTFENRSDLLKVLDAVPRDVRSDPPVPRDP